jgi:hypothetical protein
MFSGGSDAIDSSPQGYDPELSARPMRRAVASRDRGPIAGMLLQGELGPAPSPLSASEQRLRDRRRAVRRAG